MLQKVRVGNYCVLKSNKYIRISLISEVTAIVILVLIPIDIYYVSTLVPHVPTHTRACTHITTHMFIHALLFHIQHVCIAYIYSVICCYSFINYMKSYKEKVHNSALKFSFSSEVRCRLLRICFMCLLFRALFLLSLNARAWLMSAPSSSATY